MMGIADAKGSLWGVGSRQNGLGARRETEREAAIAQKWKPKSLAEKHERAYVPEGISSAGFLYSVTFTEIIYGKLWSEIV